MRRFYLLAAALLAALCPAGHLGLHAQRPAPPPLTSNRPGIGDSEAVVGAGVIQFEGGVQASESLPGDERDLTIEMGEPTLRAGIGRRVELFVNWDGISWDRVQRDGESTIETGGNDLTIGAKLAVIHEERHRVTLTVAPAWSFPVGDDEFSSGSEDPSLRLLWARSLPPDWSVSGNVVFTRTSDQAGRYWDNAVMLGISRALTPAVGVFVEASNTLLAGKPDVWTVDGGLAWVVATDVQWDLSAGHGFHDRGDAWFVSAGVTRRRRPR